MLKKIFPILIFSAVFFFSAHEIKAAGPPGPPTMGPPPCWPPPCSIPIDGGISFLIAAGVALAGKKINDFRKKSL
jgi:hypothetical protein